MSRRQLGCKSTRTVGNALVGGGEGTLQVVEDPVGDLLGKMPLILLVGRDAQRAHQRLVQRMSLPVAEIHFVAGMRDSP